MAVLNNAGYEMQEFQLMTKNLSYEGGYHRRVYYPKVVYDRSRQRLTLQANKGSNGSLSNLSSCSSLPDLPEALLQAAEEVESASSGLTGLLRRQRSESNENLQCLERCRSSRRIPFTLGEDDASSADHVSSHDNSSGASSESLTAGSGSMTSAMLMQEQELLDLVRPPQRRRSSSLRRSKSPAGSCDHRHRKVVRFADTMGLDLRAVRQFVNNKEGPPMVPSAALKDLRRGLEEFHRGEGTRYICACFKQPGDSSDFLQRVGRDGVVLERCIVGERDRTVTGTVRVSNVSFRKSVTIRYTVNNWVTFDDIAASYVLDSNDGPTDRFSFSINLPKSIVVGGRLQLCIRYDATDIGRVFWDNNYEDNYSFECYACAVPTRESDFAWLHFL